MKLDNCNIEKVLALFDKEDIPFININYLIEKGIIEYVDPLNEEKGPVLKLGANNERQG